MPVTAGVPAFLHPLPANAPPTRLTLARWLVDRKSPTAARVFVNRLWQSYFGTGIVATPEDLGTQGERPSHPELLDWLACEFMEPAEVAGAEKPQAWSIKHMHRLIVNSAHTVKAAGQARNCWLVIRITALSRAVRGIAWREKSFAIRLSPQAASSYDKLGGKPVMPPAPAFLFLPPASYGPFPWIDETGPDKYRRAVYTFRRRSTPFPMLQTFDVPNGESSCVRRTLSNSPLQALVLLNEPMFVECARALARKTLEEGGKDDESRLTYAFRRVLARAWSKPKKENCSPCWKKSKRAWLSGAEPQRNSCGKKRGTIRSARRRNRDAMGGVDGGKPGVAQS